MWNAVATNRIYDANIILQFFRCSIYYVIDSAEELWLFCLSNSAANGLRLLLESSRQLGAAPIAGNI